MEITDAVKLPKDVLIECLITSSACYNDIIAGRVRHLTKRDGFDMVNWLWDLFRLRLYRAGLGSLILTLLFP